MDELSTSNILVLVLAGMLIWLSVNVLISVIRLNRTYDMAPGRFLYPSNCKPELCQDPGGFITFIFPRMVAFAVLGLVLAAFLLVNELTDLFAGLPGWFTNGVGLFLFLPLFIWYIIFINKAARRYW